MQNENYLGVECPKCGRMFKAEKLQVVFFCNSNYVGKCPRCGCEVEAHLTQRALDEKPAGVSFIQKLLAAFRQ